MTAKALMITGAVGSALCLVGFLTSGDSPFVMVAIVSGALFGKGYGIMEMENRE